MYCQMNHSAALAKLSDITLELYLDLYMPIQKIPFLQLTQPPTPANTKLMSPGKTCHVTKPDQTKQKKNR